MRRGTAILLILLALGACGRKAPPVAPERRVPAPVSGLRGAVEGPSILLEWTNPRERADGTRLRDLTTLRVHRREERGDGEPKPALLSWGKVVGYDEVAQIQLVSPAPAQVDGERVRWADVRGLAPERRYTYVVTAVDSTGRHSPPSERLVVAFHAAPQPPGDLRATPGDRQVRLTWSPPSKLIDGSPVARPLAYRVVRALGPGGALAPISAAPLTETEFTDRELDNGRTYVYAVQAVRSEPSGSARSELSATVDATPVDLTPPLAPRNLAAVPSETAVRLAWDSSPEQDVAGYLVYRATLPGEAYARLTPAAIPGPLFIDRSVERGKTYRYSVTAVDRAPRPNESERSAPASVTIP